MAELNRGTTIKLIAGGQVTVIKELGRGGQGIVYLCDFNGKQYALKWYTQSYPDTFYNNLKSNVQNGAPSGSKAFLWPLILTEKTRNSFGYLMKLRPSGYHEFGAFLENKVHFKSLAAMINCAVEICAGFQALHQAGLSYQDINEGNFFVDPYTGKMLICDNDNVTPHGYNLGIAGKMRYMAPEVVSGITKPGTYSDCFSLAIILFRLFFTDHPLEGKRYVSIPLMSASFERKIYGTEPIFIFDPTIELNRPVHGVHKNSIRMWPLYPATLKDAFIKAFSQASIKNPSDFNKRPNLRTWQKTMITLRNNLLVDEHGNERWLNDGEVPKAALKTTEGVIVLSPKKTIYIGANNKPTGQTMYKTGAPDVWAIKNTSKVPWRVITPSGNQISVEHEGIMPVNKGLKINFPDNVEAQII